MGGFILSATSENKPHEVASEDHSSSQDDITRGLENTGEDISDEAHAGGVDEDTALLKGVLDELEKFQVPDDADLSIASTADPPDELPKSGKPAHPSHIGELPLREEENYLREALSEHDSPENTTVPGEKAQDEATKSFVSDESSDLLTEEPESELESGRQMQPSGDDGASMISVSSGKKNEDAEPIWKDEMNSPPAGEIEMPSHQETKFSPELNRNGEKPGSATGEETLEKLQPLVKQALERALEAAIPDVIHWVKVALVLKIPRQTQSIIARQLPGIVDRIVSREIEKIK